MLTPVICVLFVIQTLKKIVILSHTGYAEVIYSRSSTLISSSHIALYCAKSRVSPLKRILLAQLEHCAAVLIARLFKNVMGNLWVPVCQIYIWSHFTVALMWIAGRPSSVTEWLRYNPFLRTNSGDIWSRPKIPQIEHLVVYLPVISLIITFDGMDRTNSHPLLRDGKGQNLFTIPPQLKTYL